MFYLIFFNLILYTADINSVFGNKPDKPDGAEKKIINIFGNKKNKLDKPDGAEKKTEKSGSLFSNEIFKRKEIDNKNNNIFSSKEEKASLNKTFSNSFIWPIKEEFKISSNYGWRSNKRFHDGIDLTARPGTHILASRSGKVIYSDNRIGGYGNMVIINHFDKMYTVYAHNEKNIAKFGDLVKQGEPIAVIGSTGRSTGIHLHFEIRKGKYSVNPLKYLKN